MASHGLYDHSLQNFALVTQNDGQLIGTGQDIGVAIVETALIIDRGMDQIQSLRPLGYPLRNFNAREIVVMAPLMVLILWIGLYPAWILGVINKAVVVLF